MDTTKCPSKMPQFYGLLIILIVAPSFFILGFGSKKMEERNPKERNVAIIKSNESVEITETKDVFIYADYYSIKREDIICRAEDDKNNEIALIPLLNQKPIVYEGNLMGQFVAIAKLNPKGEKVRVYCDTEGDASGEFLIGEEIKSPFPILMIVFFILGGIMLWVGFDIAKKNIYAREKWFREHP